MVAAKQAVGGNTEEDVMQLGMRVNAALAVLSFVFLAAVVVGMI